MKQLMTAIIAGAFFVGCGGASVSVANDPTTKKESAFKVYNDTAQTYYGTGDGRTQEEAKDNALATIASRISVSIDATVSKSTTVKRINDASMLDETLQKDITSKARKIDFSDVQIVSAKQDAGTWIVVVAVDRQKLFDATLNKLKDNDRAVSNEWSVYQKASPFEKLILGSGIAKLHATAEALYPVLEAINASFDATPFKKSYNAQTQDIRAQKANVIVKIVTDKNSQSLAKLISAKLSEENIKLANGGHNVTLHISTTAEKKQYQSSNAKLAKTIFALRTAVIKATDTQGKEISNTAIKTKAGSLNGFEDALTQTVQYEKLIAEQGIFNFISSASN